MKYLIYPTAFALVALLSSCTGLDAFNPMNWWDDAETQAAIIKAGGQVIAGEWYGAAYTLISLASGWLGLKGYKKVKASPAGSIGIIAPTPPS